MFFRIPDTGPITRRQFLRIWRREHGRAGLDLPAAGTYRRYRTTTRAFLEAGPIIPWYTGPDDDDFIDYRRPEATGRAFLEVCENPKLATEVLRRTTTLAGRRDEARAVVLGCSGCDARVIVDGVRSLVKIVLDGGDVPIHVTEAVGADWSAARYDMSVICTCRSGTKV